jgi:molecular chaperone GrpE
VSYALRYVLADTTLQPVHQPNSWFLTITSFCARPIGLDDPLPTGINLDMMPFTQQCRNINNHVRLQRLLVAVTTRREIASMSTWPPHFLWQRPAPAWTPPLSGWSSPEQIRRHRQLRWSSNTDAPPSEASREESANTAEQPTEATDAESATLNEQPIDKQPIEEEPLALKIVELERQVKDLKDSLLRSLAEQENTRRIAARDVQQARDFAIKSFAKSLLDVSDNLSRALQAVPPQFQTTTTPAENGPTAETVLMNLYQGIEMTEQGLVKAFESAGLIPYGTAGDAFDPNVHEALFEYPVADAEPGTIGQVMKVGYKLNNRVLRPAEVGVIKKP